MNYQLYHGDCLEVMKRIETGSIDAVICDPPYGTSEDGKSKMTKVGNNISEFYLEWDTLLPTEYLEHAYRVLKPGGSIVSFTDTKMVTTLWNAFESCGLKPLQIVGWVKTNPPPNPRKNFASGIELGVFGRKPGRVLCWNGGGWVLNYDVFPLAHSETQNERLHPTQKPVDLMRKYVSLLCPRGGTVLDPFMGSGSTGIATAIEKLDFIGIELNETYFKIAHERIDAAYRRASGLPKQGKATDTLDLPLFA